MIDIGRAALLLIGHGSARNPQSRVPTLRLADELRRRALFAEVQACFLKEPPLIGEALAGLAAPVVFAVPNLAGEGPLVRVDIPRLLGLGQPSAEQDGRRVLYTRPVGSHPRIPELIRRRAERLMAAEGLPPDQVGLLLVGHGSSRPGGAATTAQAIAEALRAMNAVGEVALAYLEQPPLVGDWRDLSTAPNLIVAPLLIAEGLHGSEDIPPLFGLAPGESGPSRVDGRSVWLCRGIGADPEIADLILDRVRQRAAEPS
jgi:sirohydrochlorin cobaltochelatase